MRTTTNRRPAEGRQLVAMALAVAALLVLLVPAEGLAQGRRRRGDRGNQPAGGAQAAVATIVFTDGRQIEDAEIREEKFAKVKFRANGRNDEVEGERIAEIRYRDAPGPFLGGQSQLRGGNFERAVQSFTAARNGAAEGSWVKAHASFWLAEAQRQNGANAEAVTEYNGFLQRFADHWLAPAAIYGLGLAQAGANQHAQAATTLARLNTGFGETWTLRAKLGEADVLFAQDQFPRARGAYEFVNQQGTRHPSLRRAAQVGIGRCFIADQRYDDAARFFEGIISQTGSDPEVAGGAWVGIGDCRFEQAKASNNDANRLKEALIAYETAIVRYAGVLPVYAKALFHAAEIHRMLNLPQLAERLEAELRSRCPRSPWTQRLERR